MKPREVTQEDLNFWNNNDEGLHYEIGPMAGRHLGAEDIPKVLLGYDGDRLKLVKVAWEYEERDLVHLPEGRTVWTTFWGGMPPADVVIL